MVVRLDVTFDIPRSAVARKPVPPFGDTPLGDTPVGDTPVGDTPVGDTL